MDRLLDVDLEKLTVSVFKMGELAQKTFEISIDGFLNGHDVTQVVHDYSGMLTAMAVEVEEKAFALIVKFQPVASDLRIINSYIKIAYDFERFGRYAWDISFTCKNLVTPDLCHVPAIDELTEKVSGMVSKSILALKEHNAELAKTLAGTEKEVDNIYLELLNQLSTAPLDKKCAMCSILVSRFLERIADHATYVAESVIYIVTGKKYLM